MWELHCVGAALCGSCIVWELHCVGAALCGSCIVWELHCVGAALCGSCIRDVSAVIRVVWPSSVDSRYEALE